MEPEIDKSAVMPRPAQFFYALAGCEGQPGPPYLFPPIHDTA